MDISLFYVNPIFGFKEKAVKNTNNKETLRLGEFDKGYSSSKKTEVKCCTHAQ